MRKVNFKVRNIGSEKYLSYILDEDCDFDEELLDYLEDNKIAELIDIIYEEDDENDYLTYDITGRTTIGSLLENTVNAEMMLGTVRGVATGIVNMLDLGIPVSYVILDRGFTYVNPVTYDVKMICIPVESDSSMIPEFKTFVKNIIMNARYNDGEDCNYVAKLITLLNAEKFTIRTFASQITELMKTAGMNVEEEYLDIDGTGVEISQSVDVETEESASLDDLPEYKDVSFDDEDEDDLDMYDEDEPTGAESIFKDLDLDAEEPVTVKEDRAPGEINMDVFDDSALSNLEIDDDLELEEEASSEESEGLTQTLTADMTELTDLDISDIMEASTVPEQKTSTVSEIARTADGVTEVSAGEEESIDPVLIKISEILDDTASKPPVIKNIRVNRAKIIQKVAAETVDDGVSVDDNPTEQIVRPDLLGNNEPDTIMDPVTTPSKPEEESTGSTVELTAGMSVVKDKEAEAAAPAVPKAVPYLVRVNTGERVMVNKAIFKLGKAGRGVDYSISGNGAISKIHAVIYTRDEGSFIKDNKATNSTYVNQEKVEENQEVLLKNNSTITIGGEDFLFKY